jgi:hypothetical protein
MSRLVIPIIAKSKAHILPLYLNSMLAQTALGWDTVFYIRTNDNNDDTANVLSDWYNKWKWKFKMVFDDSSIDEGLKTIENHDWNAHRFKILGAIRQDSIQFAISEKSDYFIADCDNIIKPHTIDSLMATNLPVVAPLLYPVDSNSMYSNFHSSIDQNGYFANDDMYSPLLYQKYKGLIQVPVVHCTYFIKNEVLPSVVYDDNTGRYEYVIFSDSLRKTGIPQYLDTREVYGRISFSTNKESFYSQALDTKFGEHIEYINKKFKKILKPK